MNYYARSAFGTVGLCCLLVSGCTFYPDLEEIEKIIAHELEPAKLETTLKLELGPGLLSWAKLVCNWADVEDDVRECVAEIQDVQLAVYEIHGLRSVEPVRVSEPVRKRLERAGWEMLVKVKEEEELCWVFYRPEGSLINEFYVIALKNDKLVLVRVQGRFDPMIAKVLEDHDLNINGLAGMK